MLTRPMIQTRLKANENFLHKILGNKPVQGNMAYNLDKANQMFI